MNAKVLILAAGYGTRLGELTKDKPKPMVKVGMKPIIRHLLDHVHNFDVRPDQIMINLHYLPYEIVNYLGNKYNYSFEGELLGETNTILNLRQWINQEFLFVLNGDTLTDLDLNRMYNDALIYNSSIASFSNGVYTGQRIIHPYSNHFKTIDYQTYWQDCGTPEGLQKANEKKLNNMS